MDGPPPPRGRKRRVSAKQPPSPPALIDNSETRMINKNAEMIRSAMRKILADTGMTPRQWALKGNIAEGTLRHFLSGRTNQFLSSSLIQLANSAGVTLGQMMNESARLMPLSGRIISRGLIVIAGDVEMPMVDAPPECDSSMKALRVTVDVLSPDFERDDTVYYRDVWEHPEGLVGKRCVIKLSAGEMMVGRLKVGAHPGTFIVYRVNADPLLDAVVESATPVCWVKPSH